MKACISFVLIILLLGLALPGFAQDEAELQAAYEAAAASAAEYGVTETIVNIDHMGHNIVGTVAMPDGEGPFPIVLLFHGFTGTRDELPVTGTEERMFGRTARWLAERGYASLRIDFLGSGESDGAWEDTTFSGQIADALVAMEYASGLDGVDAERIGYHRLEPGWPRRIRHRGGRRRPCGYGDPLVAGFQPANHVWFSLGERMDRDWFGQWRRACQRHPTLGSGNRLKHGIL